MSIVSKHLRAACLLAPLLITGCGDAESTLSGTVSKDGEMVRAVDDIRGTVMLQPTEGQGAPATGQIDENGVYEVTTGAAGGLAPGNYAVTVNLVRVIPPQSEGGLPGAERLTPQRYINAKQSGLSVDVEPGANTYDIKLESE